MDSTGPIFQPDRHDRMEIIITKNANLVVERLRYTEFFFKLQYFYLVIMNAGDIEIDIERFIYEIQIWREFDIRRIGICSSKEDIFIRANKKNIRICSQNGIKGDKQSFFTPIC